MKTSKHGITLIEGREGIRLTVYRDSKGLPTVGVGHLVLASDGLKVGDKITQTQCDAFLAQDLGKAEAAVNSAVKVPLSQNQFDALVSFTVNIGTGGFKGSTVVKRLNAKDTIGAAKAMMAWVKPVEITGRRRSEQKQFLTPDSPLAAASSSNINEPLANVESDVLSSKPNSEQPPINPPANGTGADPSPTDSPTVTTVNQMQPYMGVGFRAVMRNDFLKLTGGNITMQTLSGYRDQIEAWGIPARIILNLSILAAALSVAWLLYRLAHYGVWILREHQRIKAELAVNVDPKTPNLQWTNIKPEIPAPDPTPLPGS